VITRVATLEAPRMGQLRNYLAKRQNGPIEMTVLRNGESLSLTAQLKKGKLGVLLVSALETPIIAQPLEEVLEEVDGKLVSVPTAIAGKQLLGGSELISIYGSKGGIAATTETIHNWKQLRFQMESVYSSQVDRGNVMLQVQNPTKNAEFLTIEMSTMNHRVNQGWTTPLAQQLFESIYVTRSSGGNPIKALQMGFDETVNMVVMTYLTIDRLIRRTVGVDQLRGPVGIIHIGSKIADRGMSYLLFFLAIISVNLAVLNFLPLPIVDGGLFLYLIYEKLFKRPPSIAFQNAAAMLGIGLIATLFIVTFYNDIARLVG
jgi:membrane-associated protease RseP (regulator of RpoE activity)